MRVALVEPYLGGSHRYWAEGYAAHSAHDVEVFGLPAIHWKWRMQGGHVPLAARLEVAVEQRGPFDALLVSSMTNLPALLGQARRSIGDAPAALYLHENQLTFPLSDGDRPDLTYPMINWISMLAADLVVWNSAFHRDDWFAAVPQLLGRMPDQRQSGLIGEVRERSTVLPVGIDLGAFDRLERRPHDRPLVLWNQRWEYDKGPADFASAMEQLVEEGVEFDVALAGQQYADEPDEFVRLRTTLGARLVHVGHADLEGYRRLLRSADIVVSTARHEFFGIAVVEAIYAGAFPVLPDRLVYPERLPAEYHERCLYRRRDGLVDRIRWAIEHRDEAIEIAGALRPTMAGFDWGSVAPRYDELMSGLVDQRS